MDRREVEMPDNEVLDADSRRVADMLGTLQRVEAPGNFEFGVRARIAAGGSRPSAGYLPFLKVAAPVALVLTVTLGVLLYGGAVTGDPPIVEQPDIERSSSSNLSELSFATADERNSAAQVADPPPVGPQVNISTQGDMASRGSNDVKHSDRVRSSRTSSGRTPDGASTDIGVHAPKVITQPGMSGDVSLKEAFQMIGLSGDFSANGWTVRSSADGSLAHRSGIREGDVVESIDGLGVSEKTVIKGSISIQSVRVLRDGKTLDIKLAN